MFNSTVEARKQTLSFIQQGVEVRRRRRDEIIEGINRLAEEQRGIQNFSDTVDEWMPPSEEVVLFLARQVPSVSLECIGLELLSTWMGRDMRVRPEVVAFRNDSFGGNNYKRGLVSPPLIQQVKGDRVVVRRRHVVGKRDRRGLREAVLRHIQTKLFDTKLDFNHEGDLFSLHQLFRERAGILGGVNFDFSEIYQQVVSTSSRPPTYVYHHQGVAAKRVRFHPELRGRVRPPAEWYYLLYLTMFCTGDRILAATTIEEDDENIREYFIECMATIEQYTGVAPLILWLPHYHDRFRWSTGEKIDFTEIQPEVFTDGWRNHVHFPESSLTAYEAEADIFTQLIYLERSERTRQLVDYRISFEEGYR